MRIWDLGGVGREWGPYEDLGSEWDLGGDGANMKIWVLG